MVDFIGVSEAISALVWSIVDIHGTGSKCFKMQLLRGNMKSLERVLREKEEQLLDLQQEIEILRNAGRILGGRVEPSRSNLNRSKISQIQMIRAVLLEHDRPLHVDELRKQIKERFGTALKNHDLTSVIYRAIRGGAFFRKEGVNTFGLIEGKRRQGTKSTMRAIRNSRKA